jgi:hypothetical protein
MDAAVRPDMPSVTIDGADVMKWVSEKKVRGPALVLLIERSSQEPEL